MSKKEISLKPWKIGNNLKSYLDYVLDLFNNEDFLNAVANNKTDVALINQPTKKANKNGNELFNLKVSIDNKEFIFYQKQGVEDEGKSKTAVEQMIDICLFFNILEEQKNDKYIFKKSLIEKIKKTNNQEIENQIKNYLFNSFMNRNENFINLINNYYSDHGSLEESDLKFIQDGIVEDGNRESKNNWICSSFFYGYLVNKNKKYEIKKIYKVKEKNSKKKKDSYFYDDFFNWYLDEGQKDKINKNYENLFDLIIENENITSINGEKILNSYINKEDNYENENFNEKYINVNEIFSEKFIHEWKYKEQNDESNNINSNLETKKGCFYLMFCAGKRMELILSIFQRSFVWKFWIIKSFLDTLKKDIDYESITYLNSFTFYRTKDGYEILDGQQRIFTIFLIIFSFTIFLKEKKINFILRRNNTKNNDFNIGNNIFGSKENLNDSFVKSECVHEYNDFLNIVKKERNTNQTKVYKIISLILNWIVENYQNSKIEDVLKIYKQIVFHTQWSVSILDNEIDLQRVYRNINVNSIPLTIYELAKNNYVYLLEKSKLSKEDKFKKVKDFTEICLAYKLEEEKNFQNFLKVLSAIEQINDKATATDENWYFLNVLEKFFNAWNEEQNGILKKLREYLAKYYSVSHCSIQKEIKMNDYPIKNIETLWYVYGATFGFKIEVVFPLVWAIFNKFNMWNKNGNDKSNYSNFSTWLFTLEKHIVYWKIANFKGQSLRANFNKITYNILQNEEYNLESFLKDLANIFFEEDLTSEEINQKFLDKIDERLSYNENNKQKKPGSLKKDSNQNIKNFLLHRIKFYLDNNQKMIINECDNGIENTTKIDNFTIEHFFPQKTNKKNKCCDDIKEKEPNYIYFSKLLGNCCIVSREKNSKLNNKDPSIKYIDYKKYHNFEKEKTVIGSGDILTGIINNGLKEKDRKSFHLKSVDIVKERNEQYIKLIKQIYKFE